MSGVTLNLRPTIQLTDEEFEQLCHSNPDLRLERKAQGELIAMSPTGSESGHYNIELATELTLWNRQARLGITFDSSTGFTLPNGAIRSPNAGVIVKCGVWGELSSVLACGVVACMDRDAILKFNPFNHLG